MKRSKKDFMEYDGLLFKISLYCIVGLLLTQLFLLHDQTRIYLSQVDKLEGNKLAMDTHNNPSVVITAINQTTRKEHKTLLIRMCDSRYSNQVFVLVNGKIAGDLGLGELEIRIQEGDDLQLDATLLKEPVQYIVDQPDATIQYPPNHSLFASSGNIVSIGKVKF